MEGDGRRRGGGRVRGLSDEALPCLLVAGVGACLPACRSSPRREHQCLHMSAWACPCQGPACLPVCLPSRRLPACVSACVSACLRACVCLSCNLADTLAAPGDSPLLGPVRRRVGEMRLNFHEPSGRRVCDECVICLTPAGREGETLER